MALYGPNLSKSVRDGTTWNQADDIYGMLEDGVRACYSSLSLWENWKAKGTADTINLAVLSAISPEDAAKMKGLLDDQLATLYSWNQIVQEHTGGAEGDQPMAHQEPDNQLYVLREEVASTSALIALVDRMFHTSVLSSVSDAIVPVSGNIGDKIANSLSALIGNFLAGIWWIILLAILTLYVWRRWGGSKLLS